MSHYVVPADVIANLTRDLEDLDAELQNANYWFERTFWATLVCQILILIILVMSVYKIYKKWGRKQYVPAAARITDCDDQRV
jgi:hypothetical protein